MKLTVLKYTDLIDDYLCITGKGRYCLVDLNCGDSSHQEWEVGVSYKLKNSCHVSSESDPECLTYLPDRDDWCELPSKPKKAKFKADPVFCVVEL